MMTRRCSCDLRDRVQHPTVARAREETRVQRSFLRRDNLGSSLKNKEPHSVYL
jgi:hypothetical protein